MSAPYLLNRDTDESKRLSIQNHLWVETLGFHVHPRIDATLPPDAVIADVGTGTGAWLISLQSTNSSSSGPRRNWTYHGLDISGAQFPAPSTLPPNTTFTAPFNLKEPVPTHLRGKFDLVHLRLLILALDSADYPTAIANLCTMLKPTGWLQWEEIDIDSLLPAVHAHPPDPTTASADPTPQSSGTYHLTRGFTKFLSLIHPRGPGALRALWSAMTDRHDALDPATLGRHVVSSDRIPANRAAATEMAIGTFRGVARRELEQRAAPSGQTQEDANGDVRHRWVDGMDMGPPRWTRRQYDEEVELMRREAEAGGYLNYKMWCCFGKKA